jgi:hypothetical protein
MMAVLPVDDKGALDRGRRAEGTTRREDTGEAAPQSGKAVMFVYTPDMPIAASPCGFTGR